MFGQPLPATTRTPLIATLAALATAAVVLFLLPPGGDLAAHLYQRGFFIKNGFAFWNNYWYAGRYSFVTYSIGSSSGSSSACGSSSTHSTSPRGSAAPARADERAVASRA